MIERALFRMGSLALIPGALIGFIGNVIHPRNIDFERAAASA